MTEKAIREKLIQYGRDHIRLKTELVSFTSDKEANELINDIKKRPHAYVLACIMDRQVKAETTWLIPHKFRQRMNQDFSMDLLANLTKEEVKKIMLFPTPLHRFSNKMGEFFYLGIQHIKTQYSNDASKIWSDKPSSSELVRRFLEFDGVGPKIATMAANILVRFFGIVLSNYSSIDISADVHVQRVFARLGLCSTNPSIDEVIYKARDLNPDFPGLLDISCWHIGRNWCRPRDPKCLECFMNGLCPKIGV